MRARFDLDLLISNRLSRSIRRFWAIGLLLGASVLPAYGQTLPPVVLAGPASSTGTHTITWSPATPLSVTESFNGGAPTAYQTIVNGTALPSLTFSNRVSGL